VSACFCVVLSCVSVEALRWTDPPTKESYQMSVVRESIKEGQGPIRTVEASEKKKITIHELPPMGQWLAYKSKRIPVSFPPLHLKT
jgi:hypothetical protein